MAIADLDKQPDSVSSVLKVFGILQALGEEREIGITELSQRVMMSKSTVYRFLQTMKSLGYVAQEGESEKYSLTLKLFELGARALQNVDLIRSADIQMRELSRLTKETVHLGALECGVSHVGAAKVGVREVRVHQMAARERGPPALGALEHALHQPRA